MSSKWVMSVLSPNLHAYSVCCGCCIQAAAVPCTLFRLYVCLYSRSMLVERRQCYWKSYYVSSCVRVGDVHAAMEAVAAVAGEKFDPQVMWHVPSSFQSNTLYCSLTLHVIHVVTWRWRSSSSVMPIGKVWTLLCRQLWYCGFLNCRMSSSCQALHTSQKLCSQKSKGRL